ncbi:MAG TPA: histidine phosphatase family protein [Mycobacteriales bacterium]|nr:histidine phosphatase family protein [Mycobacteriales bacterium]
MTQTTVHLVRHGEVDNPTGVLYGRLPGFVLSEAGHQMAKVAAAALAGRDVTVVRSSPLERAAQTAAPIAAEFGVTPTTDERLIESANFFEGKTFGVGDGSLRRPAVWVRLWNPFRPSWGEPYVQVAKRVAEAVADARDAAAGHEAVLVSHQLPIEIARRYLEGTTLWHRPDRRRCALASITSVVYDGEKIVRIDYAEPAGDAGRKKVGGA